MSLLPIITLPDPVLRQVATPIERVDDALRRTLDDMLETMYDAPGVGLAANQVAIPKRFIVVDAGGPDDDDDAGSEGTADASADTATAPAASPAASDAPEPVRNPLFLINPQIIARSDTTRVFEEGCLSLPDVRVDVERPTRIRVRYLDRDGNPRELEADGLLATVIQHEVDHLDGRLIIDYLSSLRRDVIVRRFKKLARQA